MQCSCNYNACLPWVKAWGDKGGGAYHQRRIQHTPGRSDQRLPGRSEFRQRHVSMIIGWLLGCWTWERSRQKERQRSYRLMELFCLLTDSIFALLDVVGGFLVAFPWNRNKQFNTVKNSNHPLCIFVISDDLQHWAGFCSSFTCLNPPLPFSLRLGCFHPLN